MAQAPLNEAAISWTCRCVLRGLDYMHSVRKAIHRDIKAANILVSRNGQVASGVALPLCPAVRLTSSPHHLVPSVPSVPVPLPLACKIIRESAYFTAMRFISKYSVAPPGMGPMPLEP